MCYFSVIFPPSTDTFVQARSTATANEVPNAILRSVLQGNESNIAFNNLDGFVNQASIIYVRCRSAFLGDLFDPQMLFLDSIPCIGRQKYLPLTNE